MQYFITARKLYHLVGFVAYLSGIKGSGGVNVKRDYKTTQIMKNIANLGNPASEHGMST